MQFVKSLRPLLYAVAINAAILSTPTHAVRVNADGRGDALVYPYYNVRTTAGGNAFATLITVVNVSANPKAVKVRFLESKAGAEVLDFNLFLAGYDVWAAGVVASGSGAGIFTHDNSCVRPALSRDGSAPTPFRNTAYQGDLLGDGLDRTKEGYFEILEMGSIAAQSQFGGTVSHRYDFTINAMKPDCFHIPVTNDLPPGLSRPTGGLHGSASLINVNEGTDYTIDAVALSQWSDKPQWSLPGEAHPTLADASPAVSVVAQAGETNDRIFVTQWTQGRDAVSALFMVDQVANEYTVEPNIRAATDWILTMPTKRFHTTPAQSEAPFAGSTVSGTGNTSFCELKRVADCTVDPLAAFDRETFWPGHPIWCEPMFGSGTHVCGATSTLAFSVRSPSPPAEGAIFRSPLVDNAGLYAAGWVNGHATYDVRALGPANEYAATGSRGLAAPVAATTIVDAGTGAVQTGRTVKFYGLPIVGFGAQSYSNGLLPGAGGNTLSNYGGTFTHKYRRRIEVVN